MMKSTPLSSITPFRVLAHGPNQQANNQLEQNLAFGKRLAYFLLGYRCFCRLFKSDQGDITITPARLR